MYYANHAPVPRYVKMMTPLAAVALTVTGCQAGASSAPAPSVVRSSMAPHLIPESKIGPCRVPGPADITAVNLLLAQPANPAVNLAPGTSVDDFGGTDYLEKRQAYVQAQAKKYGQVVIDGYTPARKMVESIESQTPKTFDEYLAEVNTDLAPLGFDVEISQSYDPGFGDELVHAPEKSELETRDAKYALSNILRAYDGVPRAYAKMGELQHVMLAIGDNSDVTASSGETEGFMSDDYPGEYYLELNNAPTATTNRHELGHLVSDACKFGSSGSDPAFDALNGKQDIYSKSLDDSFDEKTPHYIDGYDQTIPNTLQNEDEEQQMNDPTAYCKEVTADNERASKVMTWTNYHPYDYEDEAVIRSVLTDGSQWFALADPRFGVLNAKFELLLKRDYARDANEVRFLAAVSGRPNQINPYAKANC